MYYIAMDKNRTALERAFGLAKSGACTSLDDLKRCLKLEGYQISQIVGSGLARQLRTLIAEARAVGEGKGQVAPSQGRVAAEKDPGEKGPGRAPTLVSPIRRARK